MPVELDILLPSEAFFYLVGLINQEALRLSKQAQSDADFERLKALIAPIAAKRGLVLL